MRQRQPCFPLILLLATLLLAGCGGGDSEQNADQQQVCSEASDEQGCISFSEDAQVVFDLAELWAQIDLWFSSHGGVIDDAWSPLARVDVSPRQGHARWLSGQTNAVSLRFELGIWPQQAAQQMHLVVEDTQGWVGSSRIERPRTANPSLVLNLHSAGWLPGRYQGEIKLHLCHDSFCTQTYHGSPVRVPLNLEVE